MGPSPTQGTQKSKREFKKTAEVRGMRSSSGPTCRDVVLVGFVFVLGFEIMQLRSGFSVSVQTPRSGGTVAPPSFDDNAILDGSGWDGMKRQLGQLRSSIWSGSNSSRWEATSLSSLMHHGGHDVSRMSSLSGSEILGSKNGAWAPAADASGSSSLEQQSLGVDLELSLFREQVARLAVAEREGAAPPTPPPPPPPPPVLSRPSMPQGPPSPSTSPPPPASLPPPPPPHPPPPPPAPQGQPQTPRVGAQKAPNTAMLFNSDMQPKPRDVTAFVHVPKTAGSVFYGYMRKRSPGLKW